MSEQHKFYYEETREQLELSDSVTTKLFGRVTCPPEYEGKYHSHDFWELVYIYKAEPDQFLMELQDERFNLSENSLFLIPPGKRHVFINNGKLEAQNIYIGFSYSFSPEIQLQEQLPIRLPTDHPSVSQAIILFNELAKPMSTTDLRYILNSKRNEVMRCVLYIVNWMIDNDSEPGSSSAVRTMLLIEKIKEFLMQNLDRHISVDELARQLYLTPNYLGQIFRQHVGTTVKKYHNQLRMEAALRMLISSRKTISEISDELGFESISYFSRRFKMTYGISPSQIISQNEHPKISAENGRNSES